MVTNKPKTRDKAKKRQPQWELSERTKKALIIGVVGVVVLIGGVWAFNHLIAPAKPDLKVASAEKVADYLAHPLGFSNLPIPKREEFLVQVVQTYNTPERVESMNRALTRMSFTGRQQFLDSVFECGKADVLKAADEYQKTPKEKRQQFVDKVIRDFDALRTRLGGAPSGGGGTGGAAGGPIPQANLASPFKDHIPTKSDAWAKAVVDRTNPAERAKAKPFMDDLGQRVEQLRSNARARADFNRQP
jgi:hypothetical protein